ncbi:unnamed protein product [Arabis nemorensis]|uniref:Uncharacterized protein n=1 Tax=Arabis nemorensis TaxID=586526 RepID=A0A565CR86_9BRAS|nr:unnamed protein product [Arabis nemorensis]
MAELQHSSFVGSRPLRLCFVPEVPEMRTRHRLTYTITHLTAETTKMVDHVILREIEDRPIGL